MSATPFHQSIPFKLSVLVAGILLIIFALSEIPIYYNTSEHVLKAVNDNQKLYAERLSQAMNEKIKGRLQFIDTLAKLLGQEHFNSSEQLVNYLKIHRSMVHFFPLGLMVIPPDGKGLTAEYPPMPEVRALNFDNSEWFIRALMDSGVVVSRPFRGRASGQPLIILAAAVRDKSGHPLGVLAAPIDLTDPDFLGTVFDEDDLFSNSLIISRADKMFVASNEQDLVLQPIPPPSTNPLLDKAMEGYNGIGSTITHTGEKHLAAIQDIQLLDWFVVVHTPLDFALTPVREEIRNHTLTLMVSIIVVIIAIFIALNVFFMPLKNAADKVRTMGSDTLPHLPKAKDDEIGELIAGFNTLVDTVNLRTTELEKTNRRLEELSQTDGLTKVFNRRWFDHSLDHAFRVHMRNRRPLSLILLDIDFFKKYNDLYGHIEGDKCLIKVAGTLKEILKRPTDVFARYGGEEFAAIVDNDAAGAARLAEKMRRAIEDEGIRHEDAPLGIVTISLGTATLVPQLSTIPENLTELADEALYKSKKNGRNRVEAAEPVRKTSSTTL